MKQRNIYKSTAWLIVSALMLVVATVAWFSTADEADVNNFEAEVKAVGVQVQFHESVDGGITWEPVTVDDVTRNITLDKLLPGDTFMYRATVSASSTALRISMSFSGVSVSKDEILEGVYVEASASNMTGATVPLGATKLSEFTSSVIGEQTNISILHNGVVAANTTAYIYFNISIPGGSDINLHNEHDSVGTDPTEPGFEDETMSIAKILVSAN